ncbi:MAG: hypothetical protein NT062_27820, partial [Proteobacteria bacterium]|nr:hypothetical protein [Pseudomonadota bacterium]
MFPRVGGAILALAAAALLAVAVFATPWWLGHPVVDSAVRHLQTVDVSPLGAHGCNTGGDGHCTSMMLETGFRITGIATVGASGLLALGLLVLSVATLQRREARRRIGRLVIGGVAVGALAGIALLLLGPGIKATGHTLTVPHGFGVLVFFASIATAVAAALVTAREIPRAVIVPRPQLAGLPATPFDVNTLFGNDPGQQPPAPPAPPPTFSNGFGQGPGGVLPGPSPLTTPLFAAPPQVVAVQAVMPPSFPAAPPPPRPRPNTQLPPPLRSRPASLPPPLPRPATMPPPAPLASVAVDPAPPKPPVRPTKPTAPPSGPAAARAQPKGFVLPTHAPPSTDDDLATRERFVNAATLATADTAAAIAAAAEAAQRMERDAEGSGFSDDADHTSPNVELGTSEEQALQHDEMGSPRDGIGDVAGDPDQDPDEIANRERLALRSIGMNALETIATPLVDVTED